MPSRRLKEVIVYVLREPNQVLLGQGKRNKVKGKWGGYGGKVHDWEAPEAAAARELPEESTIVGMRFEKCGIVLKGTEPYPPTQIIELHFFLVREFSGLPKETEEMIPRWYSRDSLPFDRMWPGDAAIVPAMLSGEKVIESRLLNARGEILSRKIECVERLPLTIPFDISPEEPKPFI